MKHKQFKVDIVPLIALVCGLFVLQVAYNQGVKAEKMNRREWANQLAEYQQFNYRQKAMEEAGRDLVPLVIGRLVDGINNF